MVRIVWGVILVALGSFVIWQAIDLLTTVKAGNDLVAEFSRSLGQRPARRILFNRFLGKIVILSKINLTREAVHATENGKISVS